ncbi:MAG: hypothetical protein ACRCXT_10325, partial [Paraclostridium sp.]
MKISQRYMNEKETLNASKFFLESNRNYDTTTFCFDVIDNKYIEIYNSDKEIYIIETEDLSECMIIKRYLNLSASIESFKTFIYFLYRFNNTYIHLADNLGFHYTAINHYITNENYRGESVFFQSFLDYIYVYENKKIRKITEKEFRENSSSIILEKYRHLYVEFACLEDYIIVDEDFKFMLFAKSIFSDFSEHFNRTILKKYFIHIGPTGLKLIDKDVNPKISYTTQIENSDFFYERAKNKLVIYKCTDKFEFFSEIKIKDTYTNLTLKYLDNTLILFYLSRGNIEQNLEFHTILPNNKIFLSLKHKENKSTQNIILNTIQGETIEYKSDKENYVKNLILECNFDRTTGILIDTNKKFLFYNGKKVDLMTHYKDVSTYAVNDSIKKFKKGVSISNSTYITFEGEVLPIKSFIP